MFRFVPPIGKKARVAGGAPGRRAEPPKAQPPGFVPKRRFQAQREFAGGPAPAAHGPGDRFKRGRHVGPDFIAAGPKVRSDRRVNPGGKARMPPTKGRHGPGQNAGPHAAPPRVQQGHRPRGVDQKNGNAIGREDAQGQPRAFRPQSIGGRVFAGRRGGRRPPNADAVDLMPAGPVPRGPTGAPQGAGPDRGLFHVALAATGDPGDDGKILFPADRHGVAPTPSPAGVIRRADGERSLRCPGSPA